MKKKTIAIILGCLILALGCLFLILSKTGTIGKNKPTSELFAVKDTNNINKIFIADMTGLHTLLVRHEDGWYVQDSVKAMPERVDDLLATIHNITLQQVVAKTAQSNINKMMSVNAIKVEIYQNAPKFKLFGIPFFTKDRNVKTYYSPQTWWEPAEYDVEYPSVEETIDAIHDELCAAIEQLIGIDGRTDSGAVRLRKAIDWYAKEYGEVLFGMDDNEWGRVVDDWIEDHSGRYYED